MARASRQAAVIPYRVHDARVEIALVTTFDGRRWVVPKGSIDDGEQARDAAIRETEEEAGLLGELRPRSMGQYRYSKQKETYLVDVYAMRVTAVLDYWPEAKYRHRRWLAARDAIAKLRPELHRFVRATERLARPRAAALPSGNARTGRRAGSRRRVSPK
jgi:8-oxo-dGTP pyrophosphatase MutT (NUDIX family)